MGWPKGMTRKAWQEAKQEKSPEESLAKADSDLPLTLPNPPVVALGIEQEGNLYRLCRFELTGSTVIRALRSEYTTRLDALQAFQRYSYDQFWEDRKAPETFHV